MIKHQFFRYYIFVILISMLILFICLNCTNNGKELNTTTLIEKINDIDKIIFPENLDEILFLKEYKEITGPIGIGRAGITSNQWKLYEQIKEKYPSQILYEEYFKNDSIIVKIYLYLILWERNYADLELIKRDIEQFSNQEMIFWGGYCTGDCVKINFIIDNIMLDIAYVKMTEGK